MGKKVVEYDENGAPLTETETETPETPETEETEAPEGEETETEEIEETEETPEPQGNYRIGDKTFKTQAEALAYAQEIEGGGDEDDAYRRIVLDALKQTTPKENVTPTEPEINEEEFYANPKEFLKKFAADIKNQTHSELAAANQNRAQSDAIWGEFSSRHPDLADFREETENFTAANLADVQRIVKTKGRPAALDFVALKMRAQFERYAQAAKPSRKLPNTGTGTTPSTRGTSVTPKPKVEKPMTMREQIRSIKKVK